jgi:hypothetical protein
MPLLELAPNVKSEYPEIWHSTNSTPQTKAGNS